jgi:recombination protein RecA
LDIRRISPIKEGEVVVGSRVRVKVVKNKVAPPFRQAEYDMMHGEGANFHGEVVDLASEMGIIEKSGSWYSYKGERIGQGRENSIAFLKQNPDLEKSAVQEIYNKVGLKRQVSTTAVPAVDATTDTVKSAPKAGAAAKAKTAQA